MIEDVSIVNAKTVILSSLLNGHVPSAEECHLTTEAFKEVCEQLYSEEYVSRTNLGNVLNAEVSKKGMSYLHDMTEA